MARMTRSVCEASSLVGDTMRAWTLREQRGKGWRGQREGEGGGGADGGNDGGRKGAHSLVSVLMFWHTAREIMDVFPVPLWAWAITSLPLMIGTTALCWIAEGLSNPYS